MCMWFLSPGTLIITAVPDVTKHMKHTSWIMESSFYISPHFTPTLPPSFPSIPPFVWCFYWCLISSLRDGPFSFMQPIWLGWLYGGWWRGNSAAVALRWAMSTQTSSFAYDQFYVHLFSLSIGRRTPPHCPLPQCLLFKVTQGKLGQSSQWSRRDVVSLQWKVDSDLSLSILSHPSCSSTCSSPLSPQLYSLWAAVKHSSERRGGGNMIEWWGKQSE